jgi:hypothetical protein
MRLLLPAFLVLFLLAGCDSAEEGIDIPFLPQDARYAYSVDNRIIETDSVLFSLDETARVRTISRNATVPGYEGLIELETDFSNLGTQRTWYERTPEQLREVGYSLSGIGGAVQPRGVAVVSDVFAWPRIVTELGGRHRPVGRTGGEEDSVIVREEPRVVYEFPLEVGASWVSFSSLFLSTREVVGRETITVTAGTFDCFVIRTEVDVDFEEFEWLDYVSEEHGLVLRTMEFVGEYFPEPGPDPGIPVRSVERLELTSGG